MLFVMFTYHEIIWEHMNWNSRIYCSNFIQGFRLKSCVNINRKDSQKEQHFLLIRFGGITAELIIDSTLNFFHSNENLSGDRSQNKRVNFPQ